MSVPSLDSNKKGTITRSQARKNSSLAKEVEESSQLPLNPLTPRCAEFSR